MIRCIFVTIFMLFLTNTAQCMQRFTSQAFKSAPLCLWSTPITHNLILAERTLERGFKKNPALGYRLALCLRMLKREKELVLPVAEAGALAGNGVAKYFYATILNESHSAQAQTWFDDAASEGIGWEEFIRDEQVQLNGDYPPDHNDKEWIQCERSF